MLISEVLKDNLAKLVNLLKAEWSSLPFTTMETSLQIFDFAVNDD